MSLDMLLGIKIHPTRVTGSRIQGHLTRHPGVRHFVLHGAGNPVGPLPGFGAPRRQVNMPAEGALARLVFLIVGILVVGQKFLC